MKQHLTFVGLDVHADTIAVAAVQGRDVVRSLGIVPNTPEAIRRILGKLGPKKNLRVCYEAGPTGYVIYWQLVAMGIQCDVVAPSLVPTKASDRIKTDRRDAERLARAHRSGDLATVWVPDAAHEALRDLVRAREAAKEDQTRAKHRLLKYLLRYGQRAAKAARPWTAVWWQWVRAVTLPEANQNIVLLDLIMEVDQQAVRIARFDAAIDTAIEKAPAKIRAAVEALQSLRGVAKLTAVTLVTEIGSFGRFKHASQAMSYTGLVPSEHSSGKKNRRGAITKAAILTCAACSSRLPGTTGTALGWRSASAISRAISHPTLPRWRGKRRTGFTAASACCPRRPSPKVRSSRLSRASSSASSGPSDARSRRLRYVRGPQPEEPQGNGEVRDSGVEPSDG